MKFTFECLGNKIIEELRDKFKDDATKNHNPKNKAYKECRKKCKSVE